MHRFAITVLLFYYAISSSCFLGEGCWPSYSTKSGADRGPEKCRKDDAVNDCSFEMKDVCISGYEKSKVAVTPELLTYKYTQEEQVNLTCHTTGLRNKKFYILWKKGDEEASNKITCNHQTININLLSTATRTKYTCMVNLTEHEPLSRQFLAIEFVYVPPDITTKEPAGAYTPGSGNSHTLKPTEYVLILFATILILAGISTVIMYVVTKRKKVQKEDKQRLKPEEATSDSHSNISQSPPQLCETYATPETDPGPNRRLQTDNSPSIYSDPYVAMYSQPIPKHLRKSKNTENKSNKYSNNQPAYSNVEAKRNLNINPTARYINLKNVKQSDGEVSNDASMYDYVL